MHNLTDKMIKKAIKIRLGKFSNLLFVEILFYCYVLYRYLGFLFGIIQDLVTAKSIPGLKAQKEIRIGKTQYGFKNDVQIDLSIIIPAYNVEKYIADCIYSILNQDVSCNYEILVINDCSTDSTEDILERFLIHQNIQVFNLQENQGVSAARNVGIYNATGRYIMFLDSDDLLYGNCIQKAYDEIVKNNLDVVEFDYFRFRSDEEIKSGAIKPFSASITAKEYREIIALSTGYPWAKLYKREIFEYIRFPEGVFFEDAIIEKIVLIFCQKYSYLEGVGYLYRYTPNSTMNSVEVKNLAWDHFYMIHYCIDEAKRLNLPVDELFFRQLVLEAGLMMRNRGFYLSSSDLLFIFSKLNDLFNKYNQGFNLTTREKLILFCIEKKYINAWRWIAF